MLVPLGYFKKPLKTAVKRHEDLMRLKLIRKVGFKLGRTLVTSSSKLKTLTFVVLSKKILIRTNIPC